MQNMHWKLIIILAALLLSVWSIATNGIKRGKDLAGGLSLTYQLNIDDTVDDPGSVVSQAIDVIKNRVNPTGVLDISVTPQGRDRIELVMPLPDEEVQAAKQKYEDQLGVILEEARIQQHELEARLADDTAAETWGGEPESEQYQRLTQLEEAWDRQEAAIAAYESAIAANADQATISDLEDELAEASVEFEDLEDEVLRFSLGEGEVLRMLKLPTERKEKKDAQGRKIVDEDGTAILVPSQRTVELESLKHQYEHVADDLDQLVKDFDFYQSKRKGFDDVEDLKRLLRGAGVLEFRIGARGGDNTGYDVEQLRADLEEHGPEVSKSSLVGWYKINDLKQWYKEDADLARLIADPVGYFQNRQGMQAAEYGGDYYLLLYDAPGRKLTKEPGMGEWNLKSAGRTSDSLGRPAVRFNLDAPGGRMMRKLTGANLQQPMAIVLDDQVFSAPNINSQIGSSGIIEGNFSNAEIEYLIRVLASGTLSASLDEEPIAQNILGPSIGADNLSRGLYACLFGLIAVAFFMMAYYLFAGVVADFALLCNGVLIFGVMSMQQAAFTLPGIAGIVLTIGMAVDANVLIYERIREEIFNGETDLRTAVRLGYQKAFSTIIDANVTNLIVCFVLYQTATAEVKGFALTLGIGILATLFTALFVTRVIYTLYTDFFKMDKLPMLPTILPAVHRFLEPNIDWIRLRKIFLPISVCLVVTSLFLVASRGKEMYDTEFRGGLSATFQTKLVEEGNEETGHIMLDRGEVEDRVRSIGENAEEGSPLKAFETAAVLSAGSNQEGGKSDSFQIKVAAEAEDTSDTDRLVAVLVNEFSDVLSQTPPYEFRDMESELPPRGTTFDIDDDARFLGQVVNRPGNNQRIGEFAGGVAIVIDELQPRARLEDVRNRIERMRQQEEFRASAGRQFEVYGLEEAGEGTWNSIAVLVSDPLFTYSDDPEAWRTRLAEPEWRLIVESLREPAQLQQVASFSSSVADTLAANAEVAVILSLLGILFYIWIRFGSFRYSLAAIVALVHDVSIALGMLALTHLLAGTAIGNMLGIDDFRVDLGVVAALLTIIGYSLNDTIVILDRVRENRGKRPVASKAITNLAINQTVSRTVLTSTTTLLAVAIMYIEGGTGIRPFTFCLLIGIFIGTYSSIAIAAPLVYGKTEKEIEDQATPPADIQYDRLPEETS